MGEVSGSSDPRQNRAAESGFFETSHGPDSRSPVPDDTTQTCTVAPAAADLPESKRSGQTSSAKLVKELCMSSDTATPRTTVTLKQMAAEVAECHDLSKKQAETALSALMALATRHLQNGDKIRLTGLGVLQVQDRPARVGRNPATGEVIEIKASKKIAFRAAKELKEAV
jgi:DNA-binding protein HU-beta